MTKPTISPATEEALEIARMVTAAPYEVPMNPGPSTKIARALLDLEEQLEALREAALAVCNATSYVTDDGRVVTGDVALDERVADLYRVLSNPAKEHRA